MQSAQSFDQFWLHYLREHADPRTRRIHVFAITLGIVGVIIGLFVDDYGLIAIGSVVAAYLIAWSAHARIEHNHPAFFERPLWSFFCGMRMYYESLVGGLEPHLKRAGVSKAGGKLPPQATVTR